MKINLLNATRNYRLVDIIYLIISVRFSWVGMSEEKFVTGVVFK